MGHICKNGFFWNGFTYSKDYAIFKWNKLYDFIRKTYNFMFINFRYNKKEFFIKINVYFKFDFNFNQR